MKKYAVLIVLFAMALFLYNCSSSKKATAKAVPKVNYETQVQTVVAATCAPCHFPSKGGNKKPLDNFANVKANIDDIIARISLNPQDRGFMPFKKQKLSDSTINLFKQWRADGMLEK